MIGLVSCVLALELGVGLMPTKYNTETERRDPFVEHPVTGYLATWATCGQYSVGWEHQSGLVGGVDPTGGVDSVVVKWRIETKQVR